MTPACSHTIARICNLAAPLAGSLYSFCPLLEYLADHFIGVSLTVVVAAVAAGDAVQVLSGMARLSAADRKIVTTGGVFFSSLIKAGACINDVAAAIAALCVDNEEFSTIISRTINTGLEGGAFSFARSRVSQLICPSQERMACPGWVVEVNVCVCGQPDFCLIGLCS
jgi:hypothetical protein